MKKVFIIFVLSLFMLLTGCHVSMIGTSSFSMISDQINENNSEVKVIGEKTSKSDTAFFGLCYVLPIIGKTQLSHEVVVDEFFR
jgi:Na+-translocating ferredoxin:NAD+ oxidoreductase RNF subunit RnfB